MAHGAQRAYWQLGLIDCSNTKRIRSEGQFFLTVDDLKGKDVTAVSTSWRNISIGRQNFEFLIFFCGNFLFSTDGVWAVLDMALQEKIMIVLRYDQWMKSVFLNF